MDLVPVYVGLDYHRDTIRVCVMNELGEVLLNRSVRSDAAAVIEAVGRSVERSSRKPATAIVRGVAIEACTGSAEFASRLRTATEWPIKLAHPGAGSDREP